MSRATLWHAIACLAALSIVAGGVCGAQTNPMDSIRKLPSYRPAFDTTTLLAPERIARLAPAHRMEWDAYRARSRVRLTPAR